MAERHVVFALRRKYAELKGVLKFDPTADSYATVEAIRHVGCTLRMFSPAEDLTAIRPRRPYKAQRHTWARTALDILRREGRPMTARALARRALEAEGVQLEGCGGVAWTDRGARTTVVAAMVRFAARWGSELKQNRSLA